MSAEVVAITLNSKDANRREWLSQEFSDMAWPIEVYMPCGCKASFETTFDIPLVDTPCPCGDGRHWLVKYA